MEDSQVSDMGGSSDNNAAPRKEAEKLFTKLSRTNRLKRQKTLSVKLRQNISVI